MIGWTADLQSRVRRILRWESAVVGLVLAGCVVIPLWHWTAGSEVFTAPKARLLWSVAGGLLVIGGLGALVGRVRVQSDRVVWLVLGLGFVMVLSWITSVDRSTSLFGEPKQYQGLASLVAYLLVFVAAQSVFVSVGRLRSMMRVIAVTAIPVSGLALVERVGADPRPFAPIGRAFSTIGQPTWLGAYLLIAIVATVGLMWTTSRTAARVAWIGAAGLMVAGLVLTFSRAAYLGLAAATAVLVVAHVRRDGGRFSDLVAVGLIAAALVVVVPANNAPDPGSGVTSDLDRRSDHLSLWAVGLAIAFDHPVLGTGPDTYAVVFPAYRDDVLDPGTASYLSRFRPESPHNVPIAIAAGSGLVAIVAYGLLLTLVGWALVSAVWRSSGGTWPLYAAGAAVLAGHLVTDAFMTQETAGSYVFWALLGAAYGSCSYEVPGLPDSAQPVVA